MKPIAFYLPQFHRIPENDKTWGEGFTEWTNMKKATQFEIDQYQPRVPLNNNYYNLTDIDVIKWQVNIAKDNGIFGFCFYHYWFNGKLLLEKPTEMFLNDKSIDFPFCLSWANENWTMAWASKDDNIIMKQNYGDENDWVNHYEYFRPFFLDTRYIKNNNKPVLIIYRPEIIPCLKKMLHYFNNRAIQDGFSGLCFMCQNYESNNLSKSEIELFDYRIEYQPQYAIRNSNTQIFELMRKLINVLKEKGLINSGNLQKRPRKYSYDILWNQVLKQKKSKHIESIPCIFSDWDNTPRRGARGSYCTGVTVKKFSLYFNELAKLMNNGKYKTEYIFIFAWNEWAEGGYLEPDEKHKYSFLEEIKKIVNKYSM